MEIQVSKWGNSLAFRIPSKVAAELSLQEGSSVDLKVDEEGMHITPRKERKSRYRKTKYTLKEILDSIDPNDYDGEIDSGPEVGNEIVEWKE